MEFKEFKNKPENELQKLLGESRDKLRDLRFKVASRQLKNVREVRTTKRTIARILSLLRKKSLGNKAESKVAKTQPESAEKDKK